MPSRLPERGEWRALQAWLNRVREVVISLEAQVPFGLGQVKGMKVLREGPPKGGTTNG